MKRIKFLMGILLISISANAQFEQCNSPTTKDLWDVYFIDFNIGVAVGDSGTIVRSIDGGINWDLVMSNDTISFKKVNFFDSLNGIAVGSDIYKTNDGGQSWISQNMPNYYFDIEIINNTTCIVSGAPTAIIKSFDKGLNWDTLVLQNTNEEFGLLSFINDNIGYSCRYGGGITDKTLKTTDGGVTWSVINVQTGIDNSIIEAFDFISENIGFRAGWYNPHLMKTSDTGDNWNQTNSLDNTIQGQFIDLHIKSTQPTAYYACGWYGTVIKSIDGGNNWNLLNSEVSNTTSLLGIFFIDEDTGWVVGAQGTIIKTTNGGGIVGTNKVSNNLNINFHPNPTNGIIRIENLSEYEIISTNIFSSSGQLLMRFNNSEIIDISTLIKGIYFMHLETDEGIHIEKIIME